MATCGGLRALFEKPMPENPTLMESLSSWNHIKPKKPVDPSSFTEIFGELHFQEKPTAPTDTARAPSPPLPPPIPQASAQSPWLDVTEQNNDSVPSLDSLLSAPKNTKASPAGKGNGAFRLKRSPSLQLCTEGLGSESLVDVDDLKKEGDNDIDDESLAHFKEKMNMERQVFSSRLEDYSSYYSDVRPVNGRGFPPPISSLRRTGKLSVCFKSYREDGRFVLREIRIPGQELLLHASREEGRLKLHFVLPEVKNVEEGKFGDKNDGEDEKNLSDQEGEEGMQENAEGSCKDQTSVLVAVA